MRWLERAPDQHPNGSTLTPESVLPSGRLMRWRERAPGQHQATSTKALTEAVQTTQRAEGHQQGAAGADEHQTRRQQRGVRDEYQRTTHRSDLNKAPMTWRVTLTECDLNKAPMTEERDEHGRLTARDLNKAPMTWRVTNSDDSPDATSTKRR